MKKLYTLLFAGICTFGVSAEKSVTAIPYLAPEPSLKNVQLTEGRAEAKKSIKAEEAEGEIPETIVGKSYISFYNDGDIDCNGLIEVAESDSEVVGAVVLKEFAGGYDVNATYDKTTGKITIPVNVVIGTHSTYGDITLYSLVSSTQYSSAEPIVGTVKGNTIEFNYGVYGKVTAGGLVVMLDISATEANASASFAQGTNTFGLPLLVSKTAEDKIQVVGMSNLLYGAYCPMEFTLNETAKTATYPFGGTVDKQYTSTGYVNWVCGGFDAEGYIDDLVLNVATEEASSTLDAAKFFWGYPSGTSYRGYTFTDLKVSVDYNVFTAPVEGGEPADPTKPTIGGINYLLNLEDGTAQVTGCDESLTNLAIPAEITSGERTYSVTTVAEAAFQNNKTITSVTIPASMKAVAKDAFRNLSALQTLYADDLAAWCGIEFENGLANPIYNLCSNSNESKWGKFLVKNVNGDANTADFTNLVIPEGVTSMSRSFYGYKALKTVTLPSTLTYLGDQAFASCMGLTEVTVPEGVTSIGSAFFSCENLKKVTLPSTLETLTGNTFYQNKALEEIEIPAAVKSIGIMTFCGCTGLKKITSYAETPAEARLMAFDGVDTTIPVYVPAPAIEVYKAAAQWADFTNYQEIPGTAVVELGADAADAEYFNLQGVKVANPENGIFIRVQGGKTSKVLVK